MLRSFRLDKFFYNFNLISSNFSKTLVDMVHTMTEHKEIDTIQSEKRPLDNQTENEAKKQKIETFVRVKKRNYAMLLGYLGKNYFGMQRNPGMNTIEEDLMKAMLKANLITSESFETIQNINFQRAARTDKGVSAVRQVVSLKLPENPCKDSINEHLPEDIKVFGIKRVTKGFNSKSQCDARTYSYTMPTFAFASENLELFQQTLKCDSNVEKRMELLSIIDKKPYNEYRITEDTRQQLKELIKVFEGTQNFHNFTSKIRPLDPRAKRYIISFEIGDTFVSNNMEFITLKVKGQSFMMHQIRKMIGLVIAILRNIFPKDDFAQVFEHTKYDISRAPSLGLMLNFVHYDYYNKRYGSDGVHESLEWTEYEEEIKDFEMNRILQHVVETEIKEKSMLDWLANLHTKSYSLRDESKDEDKDETKEENTNILVE